MAHPRFAHRSPDGFTIIEMLIVVSVIALLVGLLVPALSSARRSAQRAAEQNGARQLLLGYAAYANVNDDAVLPGYKRDLMARDDHGTYINSAPARARYPWRIGPFIDYNFEGLYLNENRDYLEEVGSQNDVMRIYLMSLFPSLGLNTIWVGGDEEHGGFDPGSGFGRFYITRLSQIRHTDRLLIFASARGGDPFSSSGLGVHEGYFRLESPYLAKAQGYRWDDAFRENAQPNRYGFVSPRYGESAVTALADGHVEMLSANEFKDMRRWADDADAANWGLKPSAPR